MGSLQKNVSINYIHIKRYQLDLLKALLLPTPHCFLKFPNVHLFGVVAFVGAKVDSSVDSGGVGCHFVLQSQTSGSPNVVQTNPSKRADTNATHKRGKQKGVRYLGGWIFPRMDGYVVLITMANK